MNLSEKERHILSTIHLQGDTSITEIARQLGYQRHIVSRCLERFSEKGVLGRYALINPYALGLNEYALYFSILAAKGRQNLLRHLVSSESVCLVQEYAGEYSHSISYLGDVWRFAAFLRELSDQVETPFHNQIVALYYSYTQFQRKYLSPLDVPVTALVTGKTEERVSLDESDHQILSVLSHSPDLSVSEIARTIRVPVATVEYRIKRLKDRDVFKGSVYVFHPARLGIQLFWFFVTVTDFSSQTFSRITTFCSTHPNVTSLVQCQGSWQFEISVEVENPDALAVIKEELAAQLEPALQGIRTIPVVSELKHSLYPFRKLPWFVGESKSSCP